ncbi:MAG: sulfotransferase [Candidatus Sulfotelmatobacter sp.]
MSESTPHPLPKSAPFSVPAGLYCFVKFVNATAPLFIQLGQLESKVLASRIAAIPIDRPIYILGLPRAGTTISAQMLSEHPDVTTHRYSDFVLPYTPWWWNRLYPKLPIKALRSPVERVNRDRLQVTRDSSEGVEEMIWLRFFDQLHDPSRSNVLEESTANSDFETFLKDHIRKLLSVRGRSRYVSKNNPCVTRMRYLRRIFPDARFLLYVRNPIDHAASVLKQDRLFSDLARDDQRLVRMNKMTGFHEFGPNWVPVNVGNDAITQEIYRCRDQGRQVRARALQWASVFGFVIEQLKQDPELARAVCVVRYEDLCLKPEETIDRILAHTDLSLDAFTPMRIKYISKLSLPDYYRPNFRVEERAEIVALTKDVAAHFGYSLA